MNKNVKTKSVFIFLLIVQKSNKIIMKTHTIAVIGGTGKSGRYLVDSLLNKKYSIKLLARNPENLNIQNSLVEIIKGDARNECDIDHLIKDCNVVLSTLGQPRGESSIFSEATHNVIKAMEYYQIKRYIVTTGLSVNTFLDQKSDRVKMATEWMYKNYPETTIDKQKEYELLLKSSLDWTLVRLPLIHETIERFSMEENVRDCVGESISATDLAEFLVSQIEDQRFRKQSPFLYNIL